jgi:hypothetical protein
VRQVGHDLRQVGNCEQHADGAVELVDCAVGLDTRVIFADALTIAETGRAVIAGAGVDLAETIAHCYWSFSGPNSSSTAP